MFAKFKSYVRYFWNLNVRWTNFTKFTDSKKVFNIWTDQSEVMVYDMVSNHKRLPGSRQVQKRCFHRKTAATQTQEGNKQPSSTTPRILPGRMRENFDGEFIVSLCIPIIFTSNRSIAFKYSIVNHVLYSSIFKYLKPKFYLAIANFSN